MNVEDVQIIAQDWWWKAGFTKTRQDFSRREGGRVYTYNKEQHVQKQGGARARDLSGVTWLIILRDSQE